MLNIKYPRLILNFVIAASAVITLSPDKASAAATPDFYKCVARVGGEWNYGRAPYACNANSFGDDKVVTGTFGPLIFFDAVSRSPERARYVEELHAVIRDAAQYYLKRRKPLVSQEELDWWTLAIITTASHESFMSHYRKASDGLYKMMRGDSGHGHGVMQIDDRAHTPIIEDGIAWNLISNITYGMDVFYEQWERAPSQSCVGGATQYEKRVRAAWGAYNGGPGSICRFANPNSIFKEHDKAYYNMLTTKSWKALVADERKPAAINVSCLIENQENCPPNGGEQATELYEGSFYKLSDGRHCVFKNGQLECVSEFRDSICLNAITLVLATAPILASDEVANTAPQRLQNRHLLCKTYAPTLYAVGSTIELKKNINVRASPGGGVLGVAPLGGRFEVLDFEVRTHPAKHRYYKISSAGRTGYIYAGDAKDSARWATQSAVANAKTIAAAGETIQVNSGFGINLRATPGGTYILTVPAATKAIVQSVAITGSENSVYYRVVYSGRLGYIYSGRLLPTDTTTSWTKIIR